MLKGDRIAEVGRSVKPPEGARVIDAQGGTVMPGLVDLVVELPRGAANDVLTRAAAAYSLFGRHDDRAERPERRRHRCAPRPSAARGHQEPASRDARRPRSPRARRRQRRFAGRRAGLLRVEAEQRHLRPGPRRRGTRREPQADRAARRVEWRRGVAANAVPARGAEAVAAAATAGASSGGRHERCGGAGTRAAQARVRQRRGARRRILAAGRRCSIRLARARDAGVRLGLGSGGGAQGLPYGWSSLLGVRLFADAGLTPLQAVTAATSGGAWALGVQSDRGFLAVGQRADLLVVSGDPSSSINDIEKIAHVIFGGEVVDRAALRAADRGFLRRTRRSPNPPPAWPARTKPSAKPRRAGARSKARGAKPPARTRGRTRQTRRGARRRRSQGARREAHGPRTRRRARQARRGAAPRRRLNRRDARRPATRAPRRAPRACSTSSTSPGTRAERGAEQRRIIAAPSRRARAACTSASSPANAACESSGRIVRWRVSWVGLDDGRGDCRDESGDR